MPSWKQHNLCQVEVRRVKLAQRGRALWQEIVCSDCGDSVRKIDSRFHKSYECKVRVTTCRYVGCHAQFPADQQAQHESECAVYQRRKELLESHEQQTQMLPCDLCGQQIMARHLAPHTETQCAHRLVECEEGCGEKVPAHRLQGHKNFCTAPHMMYRRELVIRSRRRRGDPQRPWSRKAPARQISVDTEQIEPTQTDQLNVRDGDGK